MKIIAGLKARVLPAFQNAFPSIADIARTANAWCIHRQIAARFISLIHSKDFAVFNNLVEKSDLFIIIKIFSNIYIYIYYLFTYNN